jgi:hypothetical protein
MPTSTIDGTIEEAEPGRNRGGITVFKSIRFRSDDGTSRTLAKTVVKKPVADELVPGARGRFYLFNAFDMKGIHGLRTPDGRAIYEFPGSNNQKIFLLITVINVAWVVFMVAFADGIPLLGVALAILGVLGWYYMGKGQTEAKRQFDGDAGYAGPGPTHPL